MSHQNNTLRIKAVARALGELKNDVVFVGGATVSLYADRMAAEVRPTDDVDILVELYTRTEYMHLEEKLRQRGFQNDTTAKFIGRYTMPGIILDVMPVSEEILGFSNQWYAKGFHAAIPYLLDEVEIRIFTSPYFIASKLEAFKNRGNNDGRTSSDFEDIIFVFENRSTVWEEMVSADQPVKNYLHSEFQALLSRTTFEEWVDAHAAYNSPPATYFILDQLQNFINKHL
jgi:predicted nucleotidyltransferase